MRTEVEKIVCENCCIPSNYVINVVQVTMRYTKIHKKKKGSIVVVMKDWTKTQDVCFSRSVNMNSKIRTQLLRRFDL